MNVQAIKKVKLEIENLDKKIKQIRDTIDNMQSKNPGKIKLYVAEIKVLKEKKITLLEKLDHFENEDAYKKYIEKNREMLEAIGDYN